MKHSNLRIGLLTAAIPLMLVLVLLAQSPPQKPCSAREAVQFDFWIGEWNLTWNDTVTGTNVITKDLNGCVIQENFDSPSTDFKGKSFSVYNPTNGVWQQTWVDNQGSYLEFSGGMEGEKMILKRSFVGQKGTLVMQRMVYFNISKHTLDWSWEASVDSGQTWQQNWLIHYERKGT